jgi:hypothetical protein
MRLSSKHIDGVPDNVVKKIINCMLKRVIKLKNLAV